MEHEAQNNLLNSLLEKYNVSKYKIKIEKGTKTGDNFVGVLTKIRIEGNIYFFLFICRNFITISFTISDMIIYI